MAFMVELGGDRCSGMEVWTEIARARARLDACRKAMRKSR